MMFAGFNQREQDTAGLGPYIIAMKEPVLSANNEGFDRSLTSIVVDFKSPILQIKSKGIPMVQWVKYSGTQWALGKDFKRVFIQQRFDICGL